MPPKKIKTLPLHVHMFIMFVTLVLLVCGVQIWITQTSLNKVLLEANENLFERIASETRSNMSFHFGPTFSIVDAYSSGELIRETDPDKRFAFAPELMSLLSAHRHVLSFKAAFPDGEWLAVARIYNGELRKRMNVDDVAEFAAFSYNVNTKELVQKSYDAQLVMLDTQVLKGIVIDPRIANWFKSSSPIQAQVSEPYFMPIIGRSGITIHRKSINGTAFGADILLEEVSEVLRDSDENRDALRVMYDDDFNVYGYSQPELFKVRDALRLRTILKLSDINHPLISSTANVVEFGPVAKEINYEGEKWVVKIDRVRGTRDQMFNLVMAVKSEHLLKESNLVARRSIIGSLIALLAVLPCIYFASQWLARPIRQATKKAKSIENFKFNAVSQHRSRVSEIKEMSDSLRSMQSTIKRFLSLTNSMAKEDDLERLLALVCQETAEATDSNSSYLYLLSTDETLLEPRFVSIRSQGVLDPLKQPAIPLTDPLIEQEVHQFFQLKQPVFTRYTDVRTYVPRESESDNTLFIPLINRKQQVIGALGLGFDDAHENTVLLENREYLETLAAYASVTIETQTMINDQRALLDSFIQVMAGAIDTKSPYTGTHCQKVPVLTEMLTLAAQQQTHGKYADFSLNDEEWQELHMAAWMHDCGKVTIPEHIIDKSTKLETIYNRIHEIRTRFEVLKRDEELSMYRQRFADAISEQERRQLQAKLEKLDQEFDLIAEINLGSEFLDENKLNQLEQIATRTWQTTIDRRKGLSWEELARFDNQHIDVPRTEPVLADHHDQLVPWEKEPKRESRFVLQAGAYQNNQGEMYNLSVRKGTLNSEERYIINSHMIETIRMLESLPFPRHMKNVPLLAGSHHEKMDGTGYPLGTKASDLPLPARAMAIADVFEALTSCDRPYKKAKKLSEALRIMSFMVRDSHLDGDLFELFLTSGVYLDYAQKNIDHSQIDEIHIEDYLTV